MTEYRDCDCSVCVQLRAEGKDALHAIPLPGIEPAQHQMPEVADLPFSLTPPEHEPDPGKQHGLRFDKPTS